MSRVHQFRRASWGDTKQQVRAREDARLVKEEDGQLMYQTQLIGSPAYVFYDFEDGQLHSGAYLIDSADDANDVDDYFRLQEMLTKKYGAPHSKDVNWRDPYRAPRIENYAQAGKAIATGELKLRSVWFTEDTRIILHCTESTSTYNAMVWVMYHDVSRLQAAESRQDEHDLDLL